MNINKSKISEAIDAGIIDESQAHKLEELWSTELNPKFSFVNILYYFGGLVAIGAMTLFMNIAWDTFGGLGIFGISVLYAAVGLNVMKRLHDNSYLIPAGIMATFIVVLTPLAIYGLQNGFGLWDESMGNYKDYHRYIKAQWLYMELGTLAVAAIMFYKYRYPFILMPVAITLWYLSMDVVAMMSGETSYMFNYKLRLLVSLYFGLLTIGLAVWIDIRTKSKIDYSFWLYLFGVIMFWAGMSFQHSDSQINKLIYCMINILMIFAGAMISRKVFVVFGALGIIGYLGMLSSTIFRDSIMFPISLTVIGFGIIYLGIQWQKNEERISKLLLSKMPEQIRETLININNR